MSNHFGKALKTKREARSLSLQDVADKAGLTKPHVWDMEQGRSQNPCVKTILGLSVALGENPIALAACALSDLPGGIKAMER